MVDTYDATVFSVKECNRHACPIDDRLGVADYLCLWVDWALTLFASNHDERGFELSCRLEEIQECAQSLVSGLQSIFEAHIGLAARCI